MDDNKSWEKLEPTFSLVEDRLRILRTALPEAFTDGRINFETLKELLGEAVVDDEQDEHFGLSWTGKREARKLAGMPSKGTLVPVKGKGLHEDTTENIFIEGDNLEVLKLLHKSYYGKIKMIYIDPPYNTGNDFIYKDDYKMPLESYLQRSGQMNELDEMLTSNPKSSGRFHSDWLNMIYPRLRVAKDLIHDDGLIFVSIGDDELNHLICLMDELFGRENLVAIFTWKSRAKPTNAGDAKFRPQKVAEYVLAYAKNNGEKFKFNVISAKERVYPHFDAEKNKNYRTTTILTSNRGMFRRETMRFEIAGFKPDDEQRWKAGFDVITDYYNDGRIGFNDEGTPYLKHFEGDENEALYPLYTFMNPDLTGTAEIGKSDLNQLLGRNHGIDTVKPVNLLRYLIASATNEDDYILDFFAGSGTTAQAIMELNAEENSKRKFICVQIDEKIKEDSEAFKAGFRTISEITSERIRRASKKIEAELNADLPLEQKPDLGFKFYRLERSNFKAWSDYQGTNLDELRGLLKAQVSTSFIETATKDGILTEILLLEGFPLDSTVEQDETFERNTVLRVSSEFTEHRLFITLDEEIWEETIMNAEELESNDIFICLDKALGDESKIRLSDVCRLKVI